jgi:hypothetical protein
MPASGQSLQFDDVRVTSAFSPDNGCKTDIAALPKIAKGGSDPDFAVEIN